MSSFLTTLRGQSDATDRGYQKILEGSKGWADPNRSWHAVVYRALLRMSAASSPATAGGSLKLGLNDRVLSEHTLPGSLGEESVSALPFDFSVDGKTNITLQSSMEGLIYYEIEAEWLQIQPTADKGADVEISTDLVPAQVSLGEPVSVGVDIKVKGASWPPHPVRIVLGFPAGIEPSIDALDAKLDRGELQSYAVRARKLDLQIASPNRGTIHRLEHPFVATHVGVFTGPTASVTNSGPWDNNKESTAPALTIKVSP